jgi:hypothetical protein
MGRVINQFFDGFVNSPISALRFSALSLRRTGSTPHATRFARLELGLFTKPSIVKPLLYSIHVAASGKFILNLPMSARGSW